MGLDLSATTPTPILQVVTLKPLLCLSLRTPMLKRELDSSSLVSCKHTATTNMLRKYAKGIKQDNKYMKIVHGCSGGWVLCFPPCSKPEQWPFLPMLSGQISSHGAQLVQPWDALGRLDVSRPSKIFWAAKPRRVLTSLPWPYFGPLSAGPGLKLTTWQSRQQRALGF